MSINKWGYGSTIRGWLEANGHRFALAQVGRDFHLDDPQFIAVSEQLRHVATANFTHALVLQPQVNITFPLVRGLTLVDLNGRTPGIGLAFCDKNDTMNTKSKLFAQHQPISFGIQVRPAK